MLELLVPAGQQLPRAAHGPRAGDAPLLLFWGLRGGVICTIV